MLSRSVAERVSYTTNVCAHAIKGVRVAHVCRAGAGMQQPSPIDDCKQYGEPGEHGSERARDPHARVVRPVPPACAEPLRPAGGLWAGTAAAGTCVCSRRVHRRHGAARQPTIPPTPRASRGAAGRDRDPGAQRPTARPGALGLDERDELALGLRVPLDGALGHGQAGMPREFLHIPETPPDL
jgi:hypothetical protein